MVEKFKIQNSKSGFMLFLAILVSSIIIAIGLGISNFVLRELVLTATARNSSFAFHGSNTGRECAQYWDDIFFERGGSCFAGDKCDFIRCAGHDISLQGDLDPKVTLFEFSLDPNEHPDSEYSFVKVKKGDSRTRIDSFGYNSSRENNPKRVERTQLSEYDS